MQPFEHIFFGDFVYVVVQTFIIAASFLRTRTGCPWALIFANFAIFAQIRVPICSGQRQWGGVSFYADSAEW